MNVWYITMIFPAPSETFASSDVLALRRQGVEVSVHALRGAHRDRAQLVAERGLEGVPMSHAGRRALLRGLGVALTRPRLTLAALDFVLRRAARTPKEVAAGLLLLPRVLDLYDAIERERPDVVHLFWGHYPSLLGHLVQRFAPGIVSSVFLGAYDLTRGYGGSRPVALAADLVWTHAEINLEELRALGVPAAKLRLAYRGIEMAALPPQRPKVPGRIVSAGRLLPSKGMDTVLHAFARVARARPEASLVVLGDGPERAGLTRLAESLGVAERVAFRGHTAHHEVLEEMNRAEVFLFLSRKDSERLPNVVKEAIGCRCLCVTSRTAGIEELLRDGEHGYVIDADDATGAAERVERALAEPALRRRLSDAAFAHLSAHFDNDVTMARYRDAWLQAVALRRDLADPAPHGLRSVRS